MTTATMIEDVTRTAVTPRRWLSWEQAAEHAGLSTKTLQRASKTGALIVVRSSGGRSARTLIDRADLDRWLESLKTTAPAEA